MLIKHDEFGPEKILELYDPITGMRGFSVIDNTAKGPGKGGIRMSASVDKEEVFKLARTMTIKNAMAELPFGGAKSGIIADPYRIGKKKKHDIVAAFGRALRCIAPEIYVAAPDVAMGEKEIRTFVKANGDFNSATGKPAGMKGPKGAKGIPHELGSTGWGVYHATRVAADHLGMDLKGATFMVEGFGNVGEFAAKYLCKEGAVLIGVSDSKGSIYNPDGIDFDRLKSIKDRTRKVENYPDGKKGKSAMIRTQKADIFIPAGKSTDVFTEKSYRKAKFKLMVCGANIPFTPEVEDKFHRIKILVVPDFVANAGGVISSYVEYKGGKADDVFPLVKKKIRKNTRLCLKEAKRRRCSPRKAATGIAKDRIRKAMKRRG